MEVRPLPSVLSVGSAERLLSEAPSPLPSNPYLSVRLLFTCLQDHGAAPALEKGEVSTSAFPVHVWIQLGFYFSFKIIIEIGLVMLFPPMLSTKRSHVLCR